MDDLTFLNNEEYEGSIDIDIPIEEGAIQDAHILSILSDEVSGTNRPGDKGEPLSSTFNKRYSEFENNNDQLKKKRKPSDSPVSGIASWEVTDSAHVSEYTDSDEPSYTPGSDYDLDWNSYLYQDDMLPESNWEAMFLEHQDRSFDEGNYSGSTQNHDLSGDEEVPWYPYDPENWQYSEEQPAVGEILLRNGLNEQDTICYGMLHDIRVKVLQQASTILNDLQVFDIEAEEYHKREVYIFKILPGDANRQFLLVPPDCPEDINEGIESSNQIAVVNRESGDVLSQIVSRCQFSVYSDVEQWTSAVSAISCSVSSCKDMCVLVDVVIYGHKSHRDEIGNILDSMKAYLQEPDCRDQRLGYINPHFMDFEGIDVRQDHNISLLDSKLIQMEIDIQMEHPKEVVVPQDLLKRKVAAAFKLATRAENLSRIAADLRIQTPLQKHQEEALDFIAQREYGPVSQEYLLWKPTRKNSFIHVITGVETKERPPETGGGILADEMGLGKTLTMLSAIIRTASEAKAFAESQPNEVHLGPEQAVVPSRATLVVVPSPLLLNEWCYEINRHCNGFSRIIVYHGRGREINPRVLADSDIVLSTYHTISAEARDKSSPLWHINWFRIVLDEAHIIRGTTTKLFKSIRKLRGTLRWCLTGTPIQNSLQDLVALFDFIRFHPMNNLHIFKKHIVSPLMKGFENGIENLRLILDSVCLRRTTELLNLSEVTSDSRLLTFSASERTQYNNTRDRLIKIIEEQNLQPQSKGYLSVFQLQLQLRRLCNHGTFQKPTLSADEFDPEQAIAHLQKLKRTNCQSCGVNVTGLQGVEEQQSGIFTVCGHLLCSRCVPKMEQALQKDESKVDCRKCSLCSHVVFGEYLVSNSSSQRPKNKRENLSAWEYFDKHGCCTKVSALLADIEKQKSEAGKSIIFSCWTRSLDLVGIFLKSRNIRFVRIDGSHTFGQRKAILETYHVDPEIRLLLMTTGTGAVGLNLTIANCVYILEPQWNPMIESQAIARVNRFGQKRKVTIVRYIMKGTVEELELQKQQIRKLEFSKIGWRDSDESPS